LCLGISPLLENCPYYPSLTFGGHSNLFRKPVPTFRDHALGRRQSLKQGPINSIKRRSLFAGRRRSVMRAIVPSGGASIFPARLVNFSVALVSTIVSYFLIEALFFRVILPVADPSVRPQLPETPGVLAQSTKAHFVPRDYVAILGDSF